MQDFLETNESAILFSVMLAALIFASLTEAVLPRREEKNNLNFRWANNIGLTVINMTLVTGVIALTAGVFIWWEEQNYGGLSELLNLGFWPSVFLAILCFEFAGYLFHRAFHTVPWLWRIHAVHHSDTELDCSSTYRSHPLELLAVVPVTVPLVLLLDFPASSVIIYQALRTLLTIFAHSNIYLPERVDAVLRYIIVTPDFHRMHHSSDRRYTDSNFAAVLPLFDYLFGTATRREFGYHKTMEIGLEELREPADCRVDKLLLLPFRWKKRITAAANQGMPIEDRA